MTWYKKAQEFVGGDAVLPQDANQLTKVRNTESQFLPPTMSQLPAGVSGPTATTVDDVLIRYECEKCGNKLDSFEKLNYSFRNEKGQKEEAYRCSNCGYKNHYSQKITRRKRVRRKKSKKRSFSENQSVVTAATPSTPYSNWPDSNNPANQPWGRLDLTEDQRVITWEKLQDGFANEFNTQKQKKNEDYKIIKVKDKNGKIKFVKIKKKQTGADAVQPSNTWTQKGRLKQQRRYNPEDGKQKDNPGAWPHNRNLAGPGSGFYQAPYSQNMDADMRERAVSWYDHVNNRGSNSLSRPY